ncbi:TIGR04372 family glycosyltransferase [Selenomonas ruminantium]|uniref:TIGR04372 family glycosyltransferase n=1 Tax=Selenomonas ruminantium TaxID=971 RepID=UPI0026EF4762|nr:TIGR04372 family glycosyltransferase [Selenomonas ruminantium]
MLAENIEDVLSFSRMHPVLVCYGAADHGHMVRFFLEMHGFIINAFWITDSVNIGAERNGVPLRSVEQISKVPPDCGILLSLYERHQPGVKDILLRKGAKEDQICILPDLLQHEMHRHFLVKKRLDILSGKLRSQSIEDEEFSQRASKMLAKYQNISCRFFAVWRLGCYALWLAQAYARRNKKDNAFWLFFPVAHEDRPEQELRGANGYLLTLLKIDGAEVLSEKNLAFWQYMYKHHKDKFLFQDEYEYMTWSGEFFDHYKEIPIYESILSFSAEEHMRGEDELNSRGIKKPYVCISNRDSAFLQAEKQCSKKDFRDKYRNSDIETHSLAIDYLHEQGIQAVRVGALVEKEWGHDNLIDCTEDKRNEFLDVYLNSESRFFVSDLSGIMTFALLCAKPLVVLNVPCITYRYDLMVFYRTDRDLAIYKKLWDKRHNRFLTVREMLDYEVNIATQEKNGVAAVIRYYQEHDILPINNTAEEIRSVVQEMNQRIDGTMVYDSLDKELQARYREIVDNYPLGESLLADWSMGAKFLRDNQWLLD